MNVSPSGFSFSLNVSLLIPMFASPSDYVREPLHLAALKLLYFLFCLLINPFFANALRNNKIL